MKLTIQQQAEQTFCRKTSNKELRQQLKEQYGIAGRRLDNFTLSAMLTIAPMQQQLAQYQHISLFSVANFFSLELLQQLVENLYHKHPIKPLDFVASVGNAANYYIAREFNLHAANIFTAAEQGALGKGLTLAALELSQQRADAALIMHWQEDETTRLCQAMLCTLGTDNEQPIACSELEAGSLLIRELPYSVKV